MLEIRYTAPTFKAPERVRFRHRLIGFDRDWVEAETQREVRYTNLKPGDYRFEVMAANHHALWGEAPAVFAFTLAPRLWQRMWFWPACGGGTRAGARPHRARHARRTRGGGRE